MARGDGSGGVGWLITFACLALVGLIGSGVLFIAESNSRKEAETAKKALQSAQTQVTNLGTKVTVLEAIVGGSSTTNADVIKSLDQLPNLSGLSDKAAVDKYINDFKAKIELFGQNYSEARNLNSLVTYLVDELNRKNAALIDEQRKTNELRVQVNDSIVEHKKVSDEAVAGMQKAEAELAKAREDFEKHLAEVRAQMDTLSAAKSAADAKVGQVAEIQNKLNQKDKDLALAVAKFEEERAKSEEVGASLTLVPVADVIFANQLANTITINRGQADGLRRQMTLSVYGKNETNLANATPKASVEVVQVTDAHRAECRIISGKTSDPILKGDVLFTPAWKPGQKIHFALGPNMDLDGDGEATPEELETLRGLIALNGGVVDAYVDMDGNIKTEKGGSGFDYATRFYVVGLSPRRDQREVAQQLEEKVKQFGVERINIGKMLDYMGYQVKRATRSIVSSPTPVTERRFPGVANPNPNANPAAPPAADPNAEEKKPTEEPPASDDPFGAPAGEEPAKPAEPAEPADDPFANP